MTVVLNVNRRIGGLVALTLALGLGSQATAAASFGPAPGTRAPEVGALTDQNGVPRRLSDLAGSKGVVLMFFRSAGWCPFCQAQLIAMNEGAGGDRAERLQDRRVAL